ncbi:hypothetical protein T06_12739, partial [Trichinella sp. T6]
LLSFSKPLKINNGEKFGCHLECTDLRSADTTSFAKVYSNTAKSNQRQFHLPRNINVGPRGSLMRRMFKNDSDRVKISMWETDSGPAMETKSFNELLFRTCNNKQPHEAEYAQPKQLPTFNFAAENGLKVLRKSPIRRRT